MFKHARHLLFLLRRLRTYIQNYLVTSMVHLAILPTHYFYISHAKDVSAANVVVERSTHRLFPRNVSQREKRFWSNFILLIHGPPVQLGTMGLLYKHGARMASMTHGFYVCTYVLCYSLPRRPSAKILLTLSFNPTPTHPICPNVARRWRNFGKCHHCQLG